MKKYITNIKEDILFEEGKIIEPNKIYEEISIKKTNDTFYGMGGALTQASTINYLKLDDDNKKELIKSYFEDLNYKYIRLPIGSCDFSSIKYNYLIFNRFDINKDKELIHPLLDEIKKYKLTYIASPWTPPKRWKTLFTNKLKKTNYEKYANYLIDYLSYYKEYGINIEYLSIQNEPSAWQKWESCVWSNNEQKEFIKLLSEKLDKNTSIMIYDHNKGNMLKNIDNIYEENEKVKAICFHWYDGNHFDELKKVHDKYNNLLLIESEMSCGFSEYNKIDWINDAELYANEIIGNINQGMNIFVDWNLLLDDKGGPNHKKNYVKAPIIRKENYLIKTPIYYYLKHISMHQDNNIYYSSSGLLKVLVTKKDKKIITILNNTNEDISFSIDNINDTINKHTIITYIK